MNQTSHPPARSKKSWGRALCTAALALLMGSAAHAQTAVPITITGGNLTEGADPTVFNATVGSAQPVPITVRFHLAPLGSNYADVNPDNVNSNTNSSARVGFDFDAGRSSFANGDPRLTQTVTIATGNTKSNDFRIAAARDGVAETDEGFQVIIDSITPSNFTANTTAYYTTASGNGTYNFAINAQTPTRGTVELLPSDVTTDLSDACGIGDPSLTTGVCENATGTVDAPVMSFQTRVIPAQQYNDGYDSIFPYTVYVDVQATATTGSNPLIGSPPIIQAVNLPAGVTATSAGTVVRLTFAAGTSISSSLVPFVMLSTGNDNLPPVFNGTGPASNFQLQTPKTISLSARIAAVQTTPTGYATSYVSTAYTTDTVIDRYDPHGLAVGLGQTNFITSEDTESSSNSTDIMVALRGINVPYTVNGVTVVEKFLKNPDGTDNTDTAPKQDTTISFTSSDTTEGQLAYYVMLRDPVTNLPTGNPIFIQAIAQATPLRMRFVTDPNDPEYYGNYHYIRAVGVDDELQDGDQNYRVFVDSNPISFDPEYQALDLTNSFFNLRNTDNEQVSDTTNPNAAGIVYIPGNASTTVGGTAGAQVIPDLTTNEDGTQDSFGVRLRGIPSITSDPLSLGVGYVTLTLTSPRPDEVLFIDPLTGDKTDSIKLRFYSSTPAGKTLAANENIWNQALYVTVVGVDDTANPLLDGNQTFFLKTLTLDNETSDATYRLIDPADPRVTNNDNESTSFTVSPTNVVVYEGASTTFTVRINSVPTSAVTVNLTNSDPSSITVSPSTLTFTQTNRTATVTVTGLSDGAQTPASRNATITFGTAISSDTNYNGKTINPVTVSVLNKPQAINVTPTTGLTTSEAGGTATFNVSLASQPTANVVITLTAATPAEATFTGGATTQTLTFTPANFSTAQTVTVVGVDDDVDDNDQPFTITGTVASSDTDYASLAFPTVSGTNTDNESTSFTVTPTNVLVNEGATATFNVRINSAPTSPVIVNLTNSDTSAISISPATLTFTSTTREITVTVAGLSDGALTPASRTATITFAPAISSDTNYNGTTINPVTVSVLNTDTLFAVSKTSGLVTTESGGTDTFTVALKIRPTANAVLTLRATSSPNKEVSLRTTGVAGDTATLTFTSANYATPQTVTVIGYNDNVLDGDAPFTITGTLTSTDATISGQALPTITGTNKPQSISVTPTSGLVTTEAGGTATFTVSLTNQPTANVVITLTANNPAEATFTGGATTQTLTFTSANYSTAQTVTVVGVDDSVDDDNQPFTITGTIASTDTNYSSATFPTVSGTNTDNDTTPGTGGSNGTGPQYSAGTTNLVSFPYTTTTDTTGVGTATVAQAFGPMTTSTGVRYTLYRYDAANQKYSFVTSSGALGTDWVAMSSTDTLTLGQGYLLVVGSSGSVSMNTPADDDNLKAISSTTFGIALKRNANFKAQTKKSQSYNGYNLIGFPFNPSVYSSVSLSNVQVTVVTGNKTKTYETLSKAAAAGVIKGRIYGLDSQGRLVQLSATSYTLSAYKAVFVQSFRDTGTITFTLRNPS